jgi:membrane-bound serine protease (ClpP class)
MYASSIAAVAPGAQTGPLWPVDLAEPDARPAGLTSRIEGWLADREKDTSLTRLDAGLTGNEAVGLRIAALGALSVPDLLNRIDGRTAQTAAGPVELRTRIATTAQQAGERTVDIRFANMGPAARTLHAVSTPSFVYLLLVLSLAGFAFELTQPGFGFAGFGGVLLFALAVYGMTVVPFSVPGLALLVGGISLLVLDVRLRRLGPLTVVGMAAFTAGSIVTWSGLGEAIHLSPWLIGGVVAGTVLYYGFALTVSLQSRDRIVSTQRGLIGLVGEARGRLAPDGPVFVKGSLWRGRATGDPIDPGTPIRVRGVDGLVLRVEAEEPEPAGI